MPFKNRTTDRPIFAVIILAIALIFTGCASTDSDSQIRALEDDITSLKKNVSSLENSLNEIQGKNTALETKITELEVQVKSLKMSTP